METLPPGLTPEPMSTPGNPELVLPQAQGPDLTVDNQEPPAIERQNPAGMDEMLAAFETEVQAEADRRFWATIEQLEAAEYLQATVLLEVQQTVSGEGVLSYSTNASVIEVTYAEPNIADDAGSIEAQTGDGSSEFDNLISSNHSAEELLSMDILAETGENISDIEAAAKLASLDDSEVEAYLLYLPRSVNDMYNTVKDLLEVKNEVDDGTTLELEPTEQATIIAMELVYTIDEMLSQSDTELYEIKSVLGYGLGVLHGLDPDVAKSVAEYYDLTNTEAAVPQTTYANVSVEV
jgi:hypothetical protein